MSNFGETLKDLMFGRISPEELGKAIGTNSSNVHRWLKNEYKPGLRHLIKIAEYFNCSLEFLAGRAQSGETFRSVSCPSFDKRLEFLLNHYNVSIYRVTKDTKISRSVFDQWRTGRYLPQLDNLIVLADYFNCTLDFLVGRE